MDSATYTLYGFGDSRDAPQASDTEAIDYFGSDDGIETTSGSSDDEQGVDTSHSVEDMIVSVCPSLQHPKF